MNWVCEYSHKQKCFHVEELGRAVRMNLETFLEGTDPGYVVLGIFETQQQAEEFAEDLRKRGK